MSARPKLWIAAGVASLVVWSPRLAWGCAVCSAGRDDETRQAFIVTTGLLTFLPLAMIAGLVWWVRRRARELDGAGASVDGPPSLSALSRSSSSR